jgi:PAS domain S-box-containing protein
MFELDPIALGIALVLLGLVFSVVTPIILRATARVRPLVQNGTPESPLKVQIGESEEAILLVKPGGRVLFINDRTRQLFGLAKDEKPNLERMARSTRPGDAFLGLCAAEGQARFSVHRSLVDAASALIPYKEGDAVIVSMRLPQLTNLESDMPHSTGQALGIITELTQTMTASLELDTTLKTILSSVDRLVHSDFAEISLLDQDNYFLRPYRFIGESDTDVQLKKTAPRLLGESGYSSYLVASRRPLLVEDVDTFTNVEPAEDRRRYPFGSYLGVPLTMAGELVGILELASLEQGAFNQSDLEVLRILSGPAAVAMQNAIIHREEQERASELAGLARLTQVSGSLRDPRELFERLVETIAPMLSVKVLGFLIYDEASQVLAGQVPFLGMPSQFVEIYRTENLQNQDAFEIWQSQETILTSDAPNDPRLIALGLSHLIQASGVENTAFIPLSSGGRILGYMQVAHKEDNTLIDDEDLNFMTIIAGQTAPIIENVALIQDARRRTQRAEILRRIASLAGSAATLDEILKFSLQELVNLLKADAGLVLLWDETRGELCAHLPSLIGVEEVMADKHARVTLSDSHFYETSTEMMKLVNSWDVTQDASLSPVYQRILHIFPEVRSLLAVPLIIRERGVGEVIVLGRQPNYFGGGDIQTAITATAQFASAIERSRLYAQTDESLQRRVDQLTSLTRISRELNTTLQLERLLKRVYDEVMRTTRAVAGSITLFELDEEGARSTNVMLHVGDVPDVELAAVEKNVLSSGEPIIISDYAKSDFESMRKGMRSALVAPIAYQEGVAGLIHLHARNPDHFDQVALEITQALAVQAAIALGNAQRYQDQVQRGEMLHRRVEALAKLFETTQTLHLEQPLEESLEAIAYGIQESTHFEVVLVYIYEPKREVLVGASGAGLPLDQLDEIRQLQYSWEMVERLMQPEYRVRHSYFVSADQYPDMPRLVPSSALFSYTTPASSSRAWQIGDALLVPLVSASNIPLGLIAVDAPRDGLRPDNVTIETLEIFSTEAALVVESSQKLRELQGQVGHIRREYVRAEEATRTAQGNVSVLLHKDLEQTIAIQRLHDRSRRIRIGLDISEIVNRQPDRSAVLLALGHQMLTQMELDVALVAEPSVTGPRLLHRLGELPEDFRPEALLGQRNPIRTSLQTGETIFVPDLEREPDWQDSPLLKNMDAKGFISLPISTNGAVEATLLAVSHTSISTFSHEDEQIYELIGNQVAIALQNLDLLTETRRRLREVNMLLDFSRQLGTLDPNQILSALVESALRVMANAHAGVVLLWDVGLGALVPRAAFGYQENETILQISYKSGEALPGQAFMQRSPLRVDEVDFAKDYNLSSHNLLLYRSATGGRVPVSSMLIPVQSGDTMLGILVMDNFNTAAAFSQEDEALVTSLAQQTALTLENARLFYSSEQRAGQLQALTDVSTTIASSLETDSLIDTLLDQLAGVVPFDTGTLWLRQEDRLMVQAAHGFEDSENRVGLTAAVEDSALLNAMVRSGQPLSVGNVNDDPRFPTLFERRYHSWLGIPLITKGEVMGVIALEKEEINFYTYEHIQAAMTFAGQAAVALENARLFEESFQRAQELDRRSQRLAQLNHISTELSSSLDPELILKFTTRELFHAIRCSAVVGLVLSEEGAMLLAEMPKTGMGLPRLLPNAPLYDRIREAHGVYTSHNLPEDPILGPLTELVNHYNARSMMALPIATAKELHGIFIVLIDEDYHFTSDETELALTISNQAAMVVENARFFSQAEQRAIELSTLLETARVASSTLELEQVLELIAEQMVKAVDVDGCTLYRYDQEDEAIVTWVEWRKSDIGSKDVVGEMILLEHLPTIRKALETTEPQVLLMSDDQVDIYERQFMDRKDIKSILMLPLSVGTRVIGFAELGEHHEERVYPSSVVRLAEALADQAAVAIERALLFDETLRFTEELEQRVTERTAELQVEHQRARTLLRISTELSGSLDLDHVINRSLDILNETTRAEHASIILHRLDSPVLFYRAGVGILDTPPMGGRPTSIKLGDGLAGWVIQHREATVISDLQEDNRWLMLSTDSDIMRSAMAVPLTVGEDALGALVLSHRHPDQFHEDQVDLVQAAANQFAVFINNGELYRLIRDQAEDLGSMLRAQQVEATRSTAMLTGVADGVLVTDANGIITLFNHSAEAILEMDSDKVVGKSLDEFIGLFGGVARDWMDTIRVWSEEEISDFLGQDYSERVTLEDGRVVSVHLAPVSWRGEFLGTVSIFRDITHQVEVDRLKSEFVATVSHELRTPMTPIKGYVEFLLMGGAGEVNDQQRQFLEIIKSNTDRLSILVNDLLDVSRIEAGTVAFSFQPIDLQELAEETVGAVLRQSQEDNKPISLQLEIQDNLPLIYGDVERVRQILRNLVDNAYSYTPADGQIRVQMFAQPETVQVDVSDTGIGIFPEDQERIFDRFYRGENPMVMATAGTGLGLSIVKQLVEMHNGLIWVQSSGVPGEGTTFSFTLPIYESEKEDIEEVVEEG